MAALLAYLIAVGLFLGGGYGALSWLAAPEPVKVVAKAKPKQASASYVEANAVPATPPEAIRSEADPIRSEVNTPSIDDSAQLAAGSSIQPALEADSTATEQGRTAQDSGPLPDQQIRSAHAELPPASADKQAIQGAEAPPRDAKQRRDAARRQDDRHAIPTATEASAGNAHVAASVATAKITRPVKQPHLRQASLRPEKRQLTLMTLRTIEFPDGRRVSRLVPYRGAERTMAFEDEE